MNRYFVTTSIPYINGEPHLGHALEFVVADVLARQARKQGDEVIFSTGTDEHGGKIVEAANALKLTPKELADQMSAKFEELTAKLEISNNRFIRTTDKAHEAIAKTVWEKLKSDIYKSKYIGWYCTGDEAFFTESEVKATNGICPNHNRPYERVEEENYFFALSKYGKIIDASIKSDEFKILPATRKNEILSLLNSGLEDISISRPKSKLAWGIAVPNDPDQVMYVWFEALLNYLSVVGYPEHTDFKNYWPPDIQVIGKDIIRFHAAIWPAILLGLKLPLPKVLYVHGFINIDGRKMSKSLGNSIDPSEVIERFGPEALRYYLLRHIPSYSDGDFSWDAFVNSYNSELADELGNALSRTIAMINQFQDGKPGSIPPPKHDTGPYLEVLSECRFDRALELVWGQVRGLNSFIDQEKPWELAKTGEVEHLKEVLASLVSSILEIADLLIPFLPDTAERIQAAFEGPKLASKLPVLFPKKVDDKSS